MTELTCFLSFPVCLLPEFMEEEICAADLSGIGDMISKNSFRNNLEYKNS